MTHYSIDKIAREDAEAALRRLFPDGEVNEMNFVLFSTSGVHGSYMTIEDCEAVMGVPDECCDVTFLVVHPRLVCLRYGNIEVTKDNAEWLKKLRASSWKIARQIGAA